MILTGLKDNFGKKVIVEDEDLWQQVCEIETWSDTAQFVLPKSEQILVLNTLPHYPDCRNGSQ